MLAAILLGVGVGAGIPLQSAVNTRLARHLAAVLPASLVSFTVGTTALGVLVLATGTPVPWRATWSTQPWWIWLGGLCGLAFLTLNIVLMPRVGASATVVLPLVGQVFGGLAIDVTGAFGTTARALSVPRVSGAALVVLGAALVNWRRADPGAPRAGRGAALLWVVAIAAGGAGAVQTTVNGRLGQVMGSALAAALVSFLVGTAGLVAINVATRQRVRRTGPSRPWMWTGGFLGAVFVLVNAHNAPVLGTSLAVSVTLLGQLVLGLVMDHRGWFGAARRPVTLRRVAGVVLVLAGIALVRFSG